LRGLLVAVALLGIGWTFVTPAFQAPDENAHFGYVQYLAETGHLPGRKPGAPVFSTEQAKAAVASNADQAAAQLPVKMDWSSKDFRDWRSAESSLTGRDRKDAGGPNPASNNPPLYYLVEAPAYLLARGGDIFLRLELLRLVSVLWLLVTTICAWLLAGEIFGRDRHLQLLTAASTGLLPMTMFLSGSVGPDSMLFAAWALALWLGVRLLCRGVTPGGVLAFSGTVGLACVVKATSYALIPPAIICVSWAIARTASVRTPRGVATIGAVAAVGLASTLGVWVIISRLGGSAAAQQVSDVASGGPVNVREFVSYLWQFYLGHASFLTDFPTYAPTRPAWDYLFKGVWGSFGWLEIRYGAGVYYVLSGVTALVAGAVAVGSVVNRRRVDWAVAVFLIAVVVTLLAGLHVTDYRQIKAGTSFFQGRYVLPLAPIGALALAGAVATIPRRLQSSVVALCLAGFLVLNVWAAGITLGRFYA
jgi:hypothetical protein